MIADDEDGADESMQELEGKVAVVTGGASGIGSGLCRRFAQAGLGVVVADIDDAGAEKLASELREQGARALAVAVDVASPESCEALAERAFGELGSVHVLCNNAGVIVGGTLQQATEEDWRWMLSVNLGGVINGCRAFVPRLKKQGQGGHIVNTGSMGSWVSAPRLGLYCTTKFAVLGFSDALRMELAGDGIGVSLLCPGGVRTNLLEADRNRPAELSRSGGRADVLRTAIEEGIDPLEAGEHVLRGIQRNADYIFTHGAYRGVLEQRFDSVVAEFDA
jgi:NAD(P)-dependent dehydrogenase (short-subunit alcohol dehydrogenase family)